MLFKHSLKIGVLTLVLLGLVSLLSFYFTDDLEYAFTGKTISRVVIKETPPFDCFIPLKKGENMVSFYCHIDDDVMNSLKNEQSDDLDYEAIFKFNPNAINNPWNIYNKNLPNWTVQTLHQVNRRDGYWLVMFSDDVYFSEGFAFFETHIDLKTGWNLVGYGSVTERSVVDVFSDVSDKIDVVQTFQSRNGVDQWLTYVPGGENSIINVTPGESYWVHANQNVRWSVSW